MTLLKYEHLMSEFSREFYRCDFARGYFEASAKENAHLDDTMSAQLRQLLKDARDDHFLRTYLFAHGWFSKGESRGRAAVLLRQLQLKFGPLPEVVTARVQSASIEELDAWAERILSATSLDEALR